MLVKSFATPTVGRCLPRGIRPTAVLLPHRPSTAFVQDSWRPFTSAFPSHALSCRDRFQRPLYSLYIQSASKASLPRDPDRPKRPQSAYLRFAAVQREKHGLKQMNQIGAAWKQASPVEKQAFEEAAAADVALYKTEFEKYKASGKLEAWKRDPAKPQRPMTPFIAWAQKERLAPEIAKLTMVEASKALGSNWAKVSAGTKAPLEAKFKLEKESYAAAMKVYTDSGAETAWLDRTGRLAIIQKAEAKKQAQKDKIKEEKEKKMAKAAEVKEKAKIAKEKAAAKVKAEKAKEAKAATAVKAKAAKEKAVKAKAAKAAKAKAAKAAKGAKAKAAK